MHLIFHLKKLPGKNIFIFRKTHHVQYICAKIIVIFIILILIIFFMILICMEDNQYIGNAPSPNTPICIWLSWFLGMLFFSPGFSKHHHQFCCGTDWASIWWHLAKKYHQDTFVGLNCFLNLATTRSAFHAFLFPFNPFSTWDNPVPNLLSKAWSLDTSSGKDGKVNR